MLVPDGTRCVKAFTIRVHAAGSFTRTALSPFSVAAMRCSIRNSATRGLPLPMTATRSARALSASDADVEHGACAPALGAAAAMAHTISARATAVPVLISHSVRALGLPDRHPGGVP